MSFSFVRVPKWPHFTRLEISFSSGLLISGFRDCLRPFCFVQQGVLAVAFQYFVCAWPLHVASLSMNICFVNKDLFVLYGNLY